MAITAALDPVLLLLTRQHALIAGRTEQLPGQMGSTLLLDQPAGVRGAAASLALTKGAPL